MERLGLSASTVRLVPTLACNIPAYSTLSSWQRNSPGQRPLAVSFRCTRDNRELPRAPLVPVTRALAQAADQHEEDNYRKGYAEQPKQDGLAHLLAVFLDSFRFLIRPAGAAGSTQLALSPPFGRVQMIVRRVQPGFG